MAATVYINQTYGASPGTEQENVGNLNLGDSNAVYELNTSTYPVKVGENSYELWCKFHLHLLNGSTRLENFKGYISVGGNPPTSYCTIYSNMVTASWVQSSYATPVKSQSTIATTQVPTSSPASQNIGVGNSLTGVLNSDGSYSDFIVFQLRAAAGATTGGSVTLTFSYDEVA